MKPIKDILTIDKVKQDCEKYGKKELGYWKTYDFFELEDGLIIILTPARHYKIQSEIYKSDEDANGNYRTASDIAPTRNDLKELFMEENLNNLERPIEYMDFAHELYVSKPTYTNSSIRSIVRRSDSQVFRYNDTKRLLTNEEIKALKAWENEQTKIMRERLEKYWKRYQDKVWIHTYWANA